MIPLVDNLDLKARMGTMLDLAGIEAATTQAIMSAQLRIQGILDSPLSMVTGALDTFYLDSSVIGVIPNSLFQLRLRRAFVSGITSIKFGDTLDGITTEIPTGDAILLDDNLVRGYLSVLGTYDKQWISVEYDAGFDSTNKSTAPDWLKEAIICLAIAGVKSNAPPPASVRVAIAGDPSIHFFEAMANDVMMPYHRRKGLSVFPAF